MSTPRQVFQVLLISILLFSVVLILRHSHSAFYDAVDAYVYSPGNTPEDIRAEITEQLHKIQEGYTQRDTDQVEPFMEALFSQDNLLFLGTMPERSTAVRTKSRN